MKVFGIIPSTSSLTIVCVERTKDGFDVPFRAEWEIGDDDRPNEYVQIRKRLVEHVQRMSPTAVCIAPIEPMALKNGAQISWFKTAELRGVLAEASRSTGVVIEFRPASVVSKTIGDRKTAQYQSDDAFWAKTFKEPVLKKFRAAVLLALSKIKAESSE